MSSFTVLGILRKKSPELLYTVDPVEQFAAQQSTEFDKKLEPTTKDGFNLGDAAVQNVPKPVEFPQALLVDRAMDIARTAQEFAHGADDPDETC